MPGQVSETWGNVSRTESLLINTGGSRLNSSTLLGAQLVHNMLFTTSMHSAWYWRKVSACGQVEQSGQKREVTSPSPVVG